jgi:sodium/proline symporter
LGWRQLQGGLFDLYEIVPGIVFATIAIVLVSRADKGKHEGLAARFAKVGRAGVDERRS